MKINIGIITILKIKIENGTVVVPIFKWLRYIDLVQSRIIFFLLYIWGGCEDFLHVQGSGRHEKIKQMNGRKKKYSLIYTVSPEKHTR